SSMRRHTRSKRDWSSDVCSSDLIEQIVGERFIINRTYEQYQQEVDTYSEYVYTGGSCFLYELQNAMGDGKFFSMLQQYYRNWCKIGRASCRERVRIWATCRQRYK